MKKLNSPPEPQAGDQDPKHLPPKEEVHSYFLQSIEGVQNSVSRG